MSDEEKIILVDVNDQVVGSGEKIKVHQEGKLHRAFSIFVFNENGELLLQQRAKTKYHCGGLWTNSCCSHPRFGENLAQAALRRLKEEMGFTCEFEEVFSFIYQAEFANGLTEHELDHVFVGRYSGQPAVNPEEVEAWQWIFLADLQNNIDENPEDYTPWLKIIMAKYLDYLK